MLNSILVLFMTAAAGFLYFVLGQGYWLLALLAVLVLATRFRRSTSDFGKATLMIFAFSLVSIVINEFGITYPYSLILVLAGLIVLIFYEGPEWSNLYFGPGNMAANFRLAVVLIVVFTLVFCLWNYFAFASLHNPVPVSWPLDALVVIGIGFATYMAIMEEVIFRSFLQQRLAMAAGDGAAILGQGLFYGFMHYKVGVPSGSIGIVLAGLFGVALGFLVKKSNSIYLSLFVHFVVTLAVFIELAILGKIGAK